MIKNRSTVSGGGRMASRELDVLVEKVLSKALHNDVVVQNRLRTNCVAVNTNFLKKVRRLALKSVYSEKLLKINL